MDDLKIGKIEEVFLDSEIEQEEKQGQDVPDNPSDKKTIFMAIVLIIGLFALFFVGFRIYNYYTPTGGAVSIDELHQKNIENELDEEEGYMYQGYSFVKVDGLWWTEIQEEGSHVKIQ